MKTSGITVKLETACRFLDIDASNINTLHALAAVKKILGDVEYLEEQDAITIGEY